MPQDQTLDPQRFRAVLGRYPTGVCVITARATDGSAIGMVVGTFTSVSLDPPLVGFLPALGSTTWPQIQAAGTFCVNVMADTQEDLCRRIATKAPDRFDDVAADGPAGAPRLAGAIAWIDCRIAVAHPAGDHLFVCGEVLSLETPSDSAPLIFYRGGYGSFHSGSLVARDPLNHFSAQIRDADAVRPMLEQIAQSTGAQCVLSAVLDGEVMLLALSDGRAERGQGTMLQVGQRLPFRPPTGNVFAASMSEVDRDAWLKATLPPESYAEHLAALERVRQRGVSYGLDSPAHREFVATLATAARGGRSGVPEGVHDVVARLRQDPDGPVAAFQDAIRQISVPIRDPSGKVSLALTLFDFPRIRDQATLDTLTATMLDGAAVAERRLTQR